MTSPIIVVPNELLSKKIKYNPKIDEFKVIVDLMTISDELKLLGLAANQIGIETRIITYAHGIGTQATFKPLVNPRILDRSREKVVNWEACASIPDETYDVPRHIWIDVIIAGGSTHRYADFEARIIQHEVDHLDGILISDRGTRIIPEGG